jgi:hypothetical protein
MTESMSPRLPMMLRVAHWELLTVSVLLVGIFMLRQTGNLPGLAIRILDVVFVAAVLGLTMHAARVESRTRVGYGVVAVVSIVVAVVGVATASITTQRIASGLSAYVLAAAFFFIVRLVLRQERVTGDTLFGALAAYLAAAVLFAMIYTLIARTSPGAFEPPQPVLDGQSDLYYFSFVTITSLGYGDVSPTSDLTRILAPLEAVLGAILLAALVGRIVGLLVAQTSETETQSRLDKLTRAVERLEPNRTDLDRDDRSDQSSP